MWRQPAGISHDIFLTREHDAAEAAARFDRGGHPEVEGAAVFVPDHRLSGDNAWMAGRAGPGWAGNPTPRQPPPKISH
eukprot:5008714-Pyramimonas_sp.AAC.1